MSIVSATGTYLARKTPGVYITEIDAFGTGIVGVATAVPIFIGYTEFAGDPISGAPLYNQAVPISSMLDYAQYFGGAAPAPYLLALVSNGDPPLGSSGSGAGQSGASGAGSAPVAAAPTPDFYASYVDHTNAVAQGGFTLTPKNLPNEINNFNLYWSMMAFFANGGSQCFVMSVGSYWSNKWPASKPTPDDGWFLNNISGDTLIGETSTDTKPATGLVAAGAVVGPTMTVIPEACLLPADQYGSVVQAMLNQASALQDRVAIIDPPGVLGANTPHLLLQTQGGLATAIAPAISAASYGAVYAPALTASVVSADNILYGNLSSDDNSLIINILNTQAAQYYSGAALANVQGAIWAAYGSGTMPTGYTPYPAANNQSEADWQKGLDNFLLNTLPLFKQIQSLIAADMNILPASPFVAGVWSASDARNGVWNAPANIALASVVAPYCTLTDADQAGYNMPLNGQAINIIRAMPGRGNVIWGARTLDGNSNDYRYIQVRRTLIYIEQSIKLAMNSFVFAPNDSLTWSTVSAAISSFLTDLWQRGGLMGNKPSDAFSVAVGLGTTMTAQNILDGYMIVAVTLQLIHPAEFIELTFTQEMGS
jgi:hypothetical protein